MNSTIMGSLVVVKLNFLFIGEGERICILDSGVSPSDNLQIKYPVEFINLSSDSSSEDVLNHGTASISVWPIKIVIEIGYSESESKLSRHCSRCSYCVTEGSKS